MAWRKGSAHATTKPSDPLLRPYGTNQPNHTATRQQLSDAKAKQQHGEAILCTVCCCLPFGIYAIIKASKVNGLYMAGMYNEAVNSANEAKKWSTIGIVTGLVIQIVYMAVYFFVLDAAID